MYSEKKGVMGAISTDIVVSTSYMQKSPVWVLREKGERDTALQLVQAGEIIDTSKRKSPRDACTYIRTHIRLF